MAIPPRRRPPAQADGGELMTSVEAAASLRPDGQTLPAAQPLVFDCIPFIGNSA